MAHSLDSLCNMPIHELTIVLRRLGNVAEQAWVMSPCGSFQKELQVFPRRENLLLEKEWVSQLTYDTIFILKKKKPRLKFSFSTGTSYPSKQQKRKEASLAAEI